MTIAASNFLGKLSKLDRVGAALLITLTSIQAQLGNPNNNTIGKVTMAVTRYEEYLAEYNKLLDLIRGHRMEGDESRLFAAVCGRSRKLAGIYTRIQKSIDRQLKNAKKHGPLS